jgi:hypothetical protein
MRTFHDTLKQKWRLAKPNEPLMLRNHLVRLITQERIMPENMENMANDPNEAATLRKMLGLFAKSWGWEWMSFHEKLYYIKDLIKRLPDKVKEDDLRATSMSEFDLFLLDISLEIVQKLNELTKKKKFPDHIQDQITIVHKSIESAHETLEPYKFRLMNPPENPEEQAKLGEVKKENLDIIQNLFEEISRLNHFLQEIESVLVSSKTGRTISTLSIISQSL